MANKYLSKINKLIEIGWLIALGRFIVPATQSAWLVVALFLESQEIKQSEKKTTHDDQLINISVFFLHPP